MAQPNTKQTASKMIRLLSLASNSSEFPVCAHDANGADWKCLNLIIIFRVHIGGRASVWVCDKDIFRSVTLSHPAISICIDWWHPCRKHPISVVVEFFFNKRVRDRLLRSLHFFSFVSPGLWLMRADGPERTGDCNWKPQIENVCWALAIAVGAVCVCNCGISLPLCVFAKINDSKWHRRRDDLICRSKESNAKSRQ